MNHKQGPMVDLGEGTRESPQGSESLGPFRRNGWSILKGPTKERDSFAVSRVFRQSLL